MVRSRLSAGFRTIISGDADGEPDWVRELAEGDDAGRYAPDSAVWQVHGSLPTLVGGVRALLLQALHPAAVAGVDQHSTYRQDPLGRLSGTTRWLTVTTFGSTAQADREAARVRGMHRRVQGLYPGPDGAQLPYRADDEPLLAWVHAAFTDSFLAAHLALGAPIPGGPDAYVGGWAPAAEAIGLTTPPRTAAALRAQIAGYAPVLARTPATERTLAFLRRPPLPAPARLGYAVLFDAAVSTLRPEHRELLGVAVASDRLARGAARVMLAGLRAALGAEPPAARAARRRLDRLAGVGSPTA